MNTRKVFIELGFLILGIVLAFWALVDLGNNEEYFSSRSSPTYVFGLSLLVIFQSARLLLLQLAQSVLNPSGIFHQSLSDLLKLKNGQQPYLESAGFFCAGIFIVIIAAPFMENLAGLQHGQFFWLSGLLFAGVVCIIWGALKAFLTFLRFPEDD